MFDSMKCFFRIRICLLCICMAAAISCRNRVEPDGSASDEKIAVALELTKDNPLLEWNDGEQLAVFASKTAVPFDFVSSSGETSTFNGKIEKMDQYYVLYPFNAEATHVGDGITLTLTGEQKTLAGKCDPAAMLAIGKTEGNRATLKTLGSILALTINADDVQSIRIETNDETARISGKAKVTVSSLATVVITGSTSVVLSGDIKSGNTYYAVIYPGKYENLKLTATNKLGLSASYVISGEKEYRSAAVTPVDMQFQDSDWTLEVTDGQSYVLEGAQNVREFSNVNVVHKENVENLTISGKDVDTDALSQLQKRIASVTGTLILDGVGAETLAGFADAVRLEGNIVLRNNAALRTLAAIASYGTLPADLIIDNCPLALQDGQSLSSLTEIKGDLSIKNISSAFDGKCFATLKTVKGSFELYGNALMTAFNGGIKTVGGDFTIQNNTSLAGLNGFELLESIGGNVSIIDNPLLKIISEDGNTGYCLVRELANSGVISSEAKISLGTTAQTVDFAQLPNCAGIKPGEPQDYVIRSKAQMEGFINGLKEGQSRETVRNLTISGSDITSSQMNALKGRVAVVKGTLTLEYVCNDDAAFNDNNWLDTEYIFFQEKNVNGANAIVCEGSIVLRGINSYINPNGFHGFDVIHGDLVIEDCPRFPYWDGWDPFKNLTEVEGSLVFKGMERGFEGALLPVINKVGGDFIFENCGLWYFKGNNIKYIGGDLVIQGCKRLWGLNGFENLTHIGGDVIIWDNHGGDADVPKYSTVDESGNVAWYGYCLLRDFQEADILSRSANFKLGSPETGEIRIQEINTCAEGDVKSDPATDTTEGYPVDGKPIDGWM